MLLCFFSTNKMHWLFLNTLQIIKWFLVLWPGSGLIACIWNILSQGPILWSWYTRESEVHTLCQLNCMYLHTTLWINKLQVQSSTTEDGLVVMNEYVWCTLVSTLILCPALQLKSHASARRWRENLQMYCGCNALLAHL